MVVLIIISYSAVCKHRYATEKVTSWLIQDYQEDITDFHFALFPLPPSYSYANGEHANFHNDYLTPRGILLSHVSPSPR